MCWYYCVFTLLLKSNWNTTDVTNSFWSHCRGYRGCVCVYMYICIFMYIYTVCTDVFNEKRIMISYNITGEFRVDGGRVGIGTEYTTATATAQHFWCWYNDTMIDGRRNNDRRIVFSIKTAPERGKGGGRGPAILLMSKTLVSVGKKTGHFGSGTYNNKSCLTVVHTTCRLVV